MGIFSSSRTEVDPALRRGLLLRLKDVLEREFVRRFHTGDPRLFTELVERFRRPLLHFVREKVRDPDASEEITQEVFLKAFRFRDRFNPAYEPSTWLWAIARTSVFDWFRENRVQPSATDSRSLGFDGPPEVELLPASTPDPESVLLARGRQDLLHERLEELTELQKKALVLRLLHHLTYEEIARKLKLSLSAVKSLIHRAKATLLRSSGDGNPPLREQTDR